MQIRDYSTETAHLKVQNHIAEALDEEYVTALIILDSSQAFDAISLPHY